MKPAGLITAARFAGRELRGGLRGFGVFIACIMLGVAAIAGVNSVSRALVTGLTSEGGAILGGDVAASIIHREASAEDIARFETLGRLSVAATLRGMARTPDQQTLVEIKAVDDVYPLYGTLTFAEEPLDGGLDAVDGTYGAYVEPGLLDRLDVSLGDQLELGAGTLHIRGVIDSEPDRLTGGMGFGPRVLVSLDGLAQTELIKPGSLVRHRYRIALDGGASDSAVEAAKEQLEQQFGPEGFRISARSDAAPGLKSRIELFGQFLTLVGLTALIVGGVGIANAVRAHLDGRRGTIATLKALGASNGFVSAVYLMEIGVIALAAIAAGSAIGALAPTAAQSLAEALLPIPVKSEGIYPGQLVMAGLFTLLTALCFVLWPLGRIHRVPVSAIFRDQVAPGTDRPPLSFALGSVALALFLAGLVLLVSQDKRVALIFLGAMVATFILLWLIGRGVISGARNVRSPDSAIARLALANIHRPGALTGSIVLSLGLGLTLLVTLALIDSNLRRQLLTSIPEQAPSFFFVDVPRDAMGDLAGVIRGAAPDGEIDEVPMLRGRLISLNGTSPDEMEVPPDKQWALRGDRGITYSAGVPENSKVVKGAWWAEDYSGPPLVSFEDELATAFGLEIGDRVEVNVLGRTIEAEIANTRKLEWASLGINFVMVFSPNTFAGAPHMMLATVTLDDADDQQERALARAVTKAFPTVTSVRIREALNAVNGLVSQLAWAVRAASGVALAAAVLVLAGALAASHRHRIADAVILKMLGARRGQLLNAYILEFTGIGVATAGFAFVAGTLIAWGISTMVMRIPFTADWTLAAVSVVVALGVTILLGLAGTRRALAGRPASILRNL